jgi:hypothetical protein
MSEQKKPQTDFKVSDLEVAKLILERDCSQFRTEKLDELLNKIGENQGFMDAKEGQQSAGRERQWSWNPDRIKWTEDEGTKGKYQRYPAAGEKVEQTDDYKAMIEDLKQHKNRLTRDQYFYWIFDTDLSTVGRKKKQA